MRPSEMSRVLCGMRKRAEALAISQEEAQHASLLNSAPCCVSCGWPMRSKRPLQQPEASLFRHAAVVRRASCSLNDLAGVHMACASAPPHSCISGGGATRELAASARRGALVVVGPCPMKGHCAGGKPLSFGARPWRDVPDAAFQNEPAFAWHARARKRAYYLSDRGAACELAAAARAVLGWLWRPVHNKRLLHHLEASLFRRAAVVRRARCSRLK